MACIVYLSCSLEFYNLCWGQVDRSGIGMCEPWVMKRMGWRLRRLKISMKYKTLDDGKKLPTDKIDWLLIGKAIKENKDDLQGMRKAVQAIYCHIGSSDKKPEHRLWPVDKNAWCKYNKAQAESKSYKHKNTLPEAIMTVVNPTFKAFVDPSLLRKCLHGTTQNVWLFSHKPTRRRHGTLLWPYTRANRTPIFWLS